MRRRNGGTARAAGGVVLRGGDALGVGAAKVKGVDERTFMAAAVMLAIEAFLKGAEGKGGAA